MSMSRSPAAFVMAHAMPPITLSNGLKPCARACASVSCRKEFRRNFANAHRAPECERGNSHPPAAGREFAGISLFLPVSRARTRRQTPAHTSALSAAQRTKCSNHRANDANLVNAHICARAMASVAHCNRFTHTHSKKHNER